MADTLPYPIAEHYEFPRTPLAVLEDEMRTYRGGEEMRSAITVMVKAYAPTPLICNLGRYAQLMKAAATAENLLEYESTVSFDPHFLGGEILGAFCSTRPMPSVLRKYVLQQDVLGVMPGTVGGIETEPALERLAIQELAEYRRQGWKRLLELQEDPYRTRIVEAARMTYSDLPEAEILEDNFKAGYLYAANLIFSSLVLDGYSSKDAIVHGTVDGLNQPEAPWEK